MSRTPPRLLASLLLANTAALALECGQPVPQQAGPYYLEGAPARENGVVCVELATGQEQRLVMNGRVLDAECKPVEGAHLEFWQADATGNYYDCPRCPLKAPAQVADAFYCRGSVHAGTDGTFGMETTMPGSYVTRPVMHLHLKVHTPVGSYTTQLYFKHDALSSSYPSDIVLDAKLVDETWVVSDHAIVVPYVFPTNATTATTTTTTAVTTTNAPTTTTTATTTGTTRAAAAETTTRAAAAETTTRAAAAETTATSTTSDDVRVDSLSASTTSSAVGLALCSPLVIITLSRS